MGLLSPLLHITSNVVSEISECGCPQLMSRDRLQASTVQVTKGPRSVYNPPQRHGKFASSNGSEGLEKPICPRSSAERYKKITGLRLCKLNRSGPGERNQFVGPAETRAGAEAARLSVCGVCEGGGAQGVLDHCITDTVGVTKAKQSKALCFHEDSKQRERKTNILYVFFFFSKRWHASFCFTLSVSPWS